ncbi:GGDEF domain-containing protein [Isoptericola sp. b490]|uniref:GGDEF domain-containing protein n=1 Tax=Actinotalea lenta TaxID=3064654 RepID=UPI002713F281|nr:GGDEF domain-containing protein [Isoptericola sp. b490]MDO8122340.1 GGDEF domain-containing protein [Isoptericola sp. b490]
MDPRVVHVGVGAGVTALALVCALVHNAVSLAAYTASGGPYRGLWYGATLALGYALLAAGGLVATAPMLRSDPGAAIDTAIVALAAAGLVWVTSLGRDTSGASTGSQVRQAVVLVLVCAIVGLVARAATMRMVSSYALGYLVLAVSATLLGTVSSALSEWAEPHQRPWWVALTWCTASLAVAAVGARPASVQVVSRATPGRLSARRLTFLGGALALFPAMATLEHLRGAHGQETVVNLAALVLVPLVVARIALLARLHAAAVHQLTVLATRDDLTGLLNRRALSAHVTTVLERVAGRTSPGLAVLFLDLDDFKVVNDRYGHHVGDRFLAEVARRLSAQVRSADAVGRFGGDEFVLVLEGEPHAARSAGLVAVERALAQPMDLGEVVASSHASVGSAVARTGERTTAERLLSAADASMYRVKRARQGADGAAEDVADADVADAAPSG